MAISWAFNDDGARKYDDVARTVTLYLPDQRTVVSTRPYTAEENAAADAMAATATAEANRAAILAGAATILADLQTLIDTPNATINASPAPYIKGLARALRKIVRVVANRLDGAD